MGSRRVFRADRTSLTRNTRSNEQGASAIEFALVFPLFFLLFYGLVSYGLIFGIQQSLTAAAKDAARAAVACDPTLGADHDTCVTTRARSTAGTALAWFPAQLQSVVLGADNQLVQVAMSIDAAGDESVEVIVEYPGYATNPLLPVLELPGLGSVPPVPARLAGRAVARL